VLRLMIIFGALLLAACDNPGGISDADYAKYKEYGAPKILYSCTTPGKLEYDPKEKGSKIGKPETSVGYTAGIGVGATYNKLLGDAKKECNGEFKVLDSKH
jgi:hypothetical protein